METEFRPRPRVRQRCRRCQVTAKDVKYGIVVVSPTGFAHHGTDGGTTDCGHDATGRDWWWPL